MNSTFIPSETIHGSSLQGLFGAADGAAAGVEAAWFKRLFDASPDPAWIIEGNRFVECNDAAVRLLGYGDRNALLDVHPSRLSPSSQPDGESSFSKAERMMAQAVANGIHRFEWIHTRADGTDFPAEVTLSAFELGSRQLIYCIWRDISDRKATEAQLQLAAHVIAGTSEGILVADAAGIIVSVNPAFTEITGYSAAEAIGRGPNLLKSNHHEPGFYRDLWAALEQAGHWEGEIWNRRKNGEVYPEWLSITSVPARGAEPLRYIAVFHDITERHRAEERMRYLAFHDVLTGLPNRALFQDRLEHAIEVARRSGKQLALAFIDLDGFKGVNDTLGHDIGDLLLREVALRIGRRVRRSADTVARLGGDEFVVLMEDPKDPENCALLVESIIEEISLPVSLRGHRVKIGASAGLAMFPDDGESSIELMKRADAAMYSAKAAGKGAFRFFQSRMLDEITARQGLETELREALAHDALELHYQPKVSMIDGAMSGVEALLRWNHPERGLVMPSDFIPFAEETGLIVPLGLWVLEEACRQLAAWHAAGHVTAVAVNVSARQLARPDFSGRVEALLRQHDLPPSALQIEITENTFLKDVEVVTDNLKRLRDLGVPIAIDDFGTGYSSLARLSNLPISQVKIDRSFVMKAEDGSRDAMVIRTMIALANALGLDVIAEGVESESQIKLLRDSGCEICQGFYYSRPLPASQLLERWLRNA